MEAFPGIEIILLAVFALVAAIMLIGALVIFVVSSIMNSGDGECAGGLDADDRDVPDAYHVASARKALAIGMKRQTVVAVYGEKFVQLAEAEITGEIKPH